VTIFLSFSPYFSNSKILNKSEISKMCQSKINSHQKVWRNKESSHAQEVRGGSNRGAQNSRKNNVIQINTKVEPLE